MFKLCWHDWSSWSKVFEQAVSSNTSVKVQTSCCKKCKKVKLRFLWFSSYVSADSINKALEKEIV